MKIFYTFVLLSFACHFHWLALGLGPGWLALALGLLGPINPSFRLFASREQKSCEVVKLAALVRDVNFEGRGGLYGVPVPTGILSLT